MLKNLLIDQFESSRYAVIDTLSENILKYDDLKNLQDHILNLYKNNFFKKSSIGRNLHIEQDRRGDFIYWLNPESQISIEKYCLQFLESIKMIMNREFFLGLSHFEAHWTVYPPGTFYEKHLDAFKSDSVGLKRKYTLILYLNSQYQNEDEGQLVLYNNENQILKKIEPLFGRMVCFMSSEFPHEVLKIKNKERVSLTAWFLGS